MLKRYVLFETKPSKHVAAPFSNWAGAQPAFSSPIDASLLSWAGGVCPLVHTRKISGDRANSKLGQRSDGALGRVWEQIGNSNPEPGGCRSKMVLVKGGKVQTEQMFFYRLARFGDVTTAEAASGVEAPAAGVRAFMG